MAYKDVRHETSLLGTLAARSIIDTFLPDYLHSQHNSTAGGWYYYLTHYSPQLGADLAHMIQSVDPRLAPGTADVVVAKRHEPGIFSQPHAEEIYDYMESIGSRAKLGGGALKISTVSAREKNPHARGHINEVPYFGLTRFAEPPVDAKNILEAKATHLYNELGAAQAWLDNLEPTHMNPTQQHIAATADKWIDFWKEAAQDGLRSKVFRRMQSADEVLTPDTYSMSLLEYQLYAQLPLGMVCRLSRELNHPQAEQAAAQLRNTLQFDKKLEIRPLSPSETTKVQLGSFLLSLLSDKETTC